MVAGVEMRILIILLSWPACYGLHFLTLELADYIRLMPEETHIEELNVLWLGLLCVIMSVAAMGVFCIPIVLIGLAMPTQSDNKV
jgi:hypothetical protein